MKRPRTADQARLPVRVCFVIDRLRCGGTETQLLSLIGGLNRARVTPYLCLLDGSGDVAELPIPNGCEVLRLGVRSLHHPSTLKAAWRFALFLHRAGIDVVQTHFPDSSYFAVPLARLAGVRRVVRTRRDLGFSIRPIDRVLTRIHSMIVDVTLANSQAAREAVIRQEGARPGTVFVLENGVDLARFTAIPLVRPSDDRGQRRVGMVANLRPVKAPDVFIRAAAIVASSFPDVSFQLAGGGDVESARRLARECGVERRILLAGPVPDVPAFLSALDVAVLTSRSEGLSNALLEYMAAGRPIVATAVGGNPELIQDGVHGILVPPDSADAVARAIGAFLRDPAKAAALGAAARKRVVERYSRETMVARCEAFYLRMARCSGRPTEAT